MLKYWLFVGPCSLLFITNFLGFLFERECTAEILRIHLGQEPAALEPAIVELALILFRASALMGAASAFLSIYLFRVMCVVERGRVIAFLGIMVGGTLALMTSVVALNLLGVVWLSVAEGVLFIPITIGLFLGFFGDPAPPAAEKKAGG
jgi:hypothetical protein